MDVSFEQFAGYRCARATAGALTLWVTTDVGPRIIGLNVKNGQNVMAVVPQRQLTTRSGPYQLRGGHRLWFAPENPPVTYLPDDEPLTVDVSSDSISLTQPPLGGVERRLRIAVQDDQITVDHTITNVSSEPVELACWAITQLRPGGFAIMPQTVADPENVLPSRHIAIWPYSDVTLPQLVWGNRYILLHATLQQEKFKIGWENQRGWIAYHVDDLLFVKYADFVPDAGYYDFGASSQIYCDADFIEVETLGPRRLLTPNGTAVHRERWQLFDNVQLAADEAAIAGWDQRKHRK